MTKFKYGYDVYQMHVDYSWTAIEIYKTDAGLLKENLEIFRFDFDPRIYKLL